MALVVEIDINTEVSRLYADELYAVERNSIDLNSISSNSDSLCFIKLHPLSPDPIYILLYISY